MSEMRFVVNERGKEQLVIDDAILRFHNFAGAQTEYNAKGNRNIDVILPDSKMAVEMGEKGWNVKIRKPRNEDEDPYYTLNVKINMESKWPPKIIQVNRAQKIQYDAEMVDDLDDVNMMDIGMVINGSEWESQFGHGVKAYLDQLYFRVKPGVFGHKYDIEEEPEMETEDIPF